VRIDRISTSTSFRTCRTSAWHLLEQPKDFLLRHGFIESDVVIEAWADQSALKEARRLLVETSRS